MSIEEEEEEELLQKRFRRSYRWQEYGHSWVFTASNESIDPLFGLQEEDYEVQRDLEKFLEGVGLDEDLYSDTCEYQVCPEEWVDWFTEDDSEDWIPETLRG